MRSGLPSRSSRGSARLRPLGFGAAAFTSLRERRLVGGTGIEPVTPSMSRKCSSAELTARSSAKGPDLLGKTGKAAVQGRPSPDRAGARFNCAMPARSSPRGPAPRFMSGDRPEPFASSAGDHEPISSCRSALGSHVGDALFRKAGLGGAVQLRGRGGVLAALGGGAGEGCAVQVLRANRGVAGRARGIGRTGSRPGPARFAPWRRRRHKKKQR